MSWPGSDPPTTSPGVGGVVEVDLDSRLRDARLPRDLLIGQPRGHKRGNLSFATGEQLPDHGHLKRERSSTRSLPEGSVRTTRGSKTEAKANSRELRGG